MLFLVCSFPVNLLFNRPFLTDGRDTDSEPARQLGNSNAPVTVSGNSICSNYFIIHFNDDNSTSKIPGKKVVSLAQQWRQKTSVLIQIHH